MKINNIKLVNFRNYEKLDLDFADQLNIIYGLNGTGKTNLVEAIYLLSLTKSFRISNDKILIKKGAIKAKIRGEVRKNNDVSCYGVDISNDGKTVTVDEQKIDKISDYVSRINVVLFNPTDIRLIDEAPEKRRKLINIEISGLYKEYLAILSNYSQILKQRNFYLRSMYVNGNNKTDYLDILTKKLIEYGMMLSKYREEFISRINEYITDIYSGIFKSGELKVKYISTYKGKTASELFEFYKKNYKKEMEVGKTLYGPHHDDIAFIVDNYNLKEMGSEGQRKNAMISFKLAEISLIKEVKGYYPILILDDLFSELDKGKVLNIFSLLNKDVQTFITTTEIKNINKKIISNAKIFKVDYGIIEEEKHE